MEMLGFDVARFEAFDPQALNAGATI